MNQKRASFSCVISEKVFLNHILPTEAIPASSLGSCWREADSRALARRRPLDSPSLAGHREGAAKKRAVKVSAKSADCRLRWTKENGDSAGT